MPTVALTYSNVIAVKMSSQMENGFVAISSFDCKKFVFVINRKRVCRNLCVTNCRESCLLNFLGKRTKGARTYWSYELQPTSLKNVYHSGGHFRWRFCTKRRKKLSLHSNHRLRYVIAEHTLSFSTWGAIFHSCCVSATGGKTSKYDFSFWSNYLP
jgi:hypothetical protein